MRIMSSDLISILDKKLSKSDQLVWNRIGEKLCRLRFSADKEKNILLSIEDELGTDVVVVYCATKHCLPINICLILLKEGYSIRCIDWHDKIHEEIIFDSTAADFCKFIQNLQSIADELGLVLRLSDNPLKDYQIGTCFVRMRDLECSVKLVGILMNPSKVFKVSLLDNEISTDYIVSHIDKTRCRLIVEETIPTIHGKRVVTSYHYCL